jgi:3'-phosphoadenosine 5'-phosphosulfate sulfotransferase (PAPS reductase)/FAD synthetase
VNQPYKIVSPSVICFSGGRTSGMMLYKILADFDGILPPEVNVAFENTGMERLETLDFIHEVETRWNVPIVWLEYNDEFNVEDYRKADGTLADRRRKFTAADLADPNQRGFKVVTYETASRKGEPFDAMLRYYAEFRRVVKGDPPILPTVPSRMCTTHLKIKTNTRWMMSMGYDYFDAVQGIRFDEPRRWAKMIAQNSKGNERYNSVLPLYDAGVVKADVFNFWQAQPFDLQLDPESYAGNCNFCFLKNTDKIVNLMRLRFSETEGSIPSDIQWWIDKEANAGMTFRQNRSYQGMVQIAQSSVVVPNSTQPTIDCVCGAADD